jgi:hypothetical protein
LEHLPFEVREKAIKECIRVARKKCIINGPHGELGLIGDTNFKNSFERLSHGLPTWLEEHFNHGFPKASETLSYITRSGYSPEISVNETFVQHYSGLLMDIFYVNSSHIYQILCNKNGNASIGSIDGDLPYSLLFCINKSESVQAHPDPFFKKLPSTSSGLDSSSEISIFSIFHDAAYSAFSGVYKDMDIFTIIKPFFVNGGLGSKFHQLTEPDGFFENQNNRSSELTAIHYIWRNKLFLDIVGICHYRRYLYLFENDLDNELPDQFQLHMPAKDFKDATHKVEDAQQIKKLLGEYDLLTSTPRILDQTIENHYNLNHFAQDYYTCIQVMLKDYPFLEKSVFESMSSNRLYTSNIFITHSVIFDDICKVWFDILEKSTKNNNILNRRDYQKRDIAFLSERVFDILMRHLKSLNYKICELPLLHIDF